MFKILADATLPLLDLFEPPFIVTRYSDKNSLQTHLPSHDILLCRSTLTVDEPLLADTAIQSVATASSGVDHIDIAYLEQRQISLFDAKGCNAHAVADYVTSTLSWLLKHQLIQNKTAGVVGLGHVGQKVATRLKDFGLTVYHYDPLRAQTQSDFETCTLDEIKSCDLISLHANLHDTQPFATRKLINEAFLKDLAPNTVLINASRGDIVDEHALLSSSIIYCTDVYAHEPQIAAAIIDYAKLCTPHIAGHSIEAKKNAIIDLMIKLHTHVGQSLPHQISAYSPVSLVSDKHYSLEDNWLKHYDPSKETSALKTAKDKTQGFLELRRAHCFRHDVSFQQDL